MYEINTLIRHWACVAWINSACSVGSQRRWAMGFGEVDTHLSGTDSGADSGADSGTARVNSPAAPLFVTLTAHHCHSSVDLLSGFIQFTLSQTV